MSPSSSLNSSPARRIYPHRHLLHLHASRSHPRPPHTHPTSLHFHQWPCPVWLCHQDGTCRLWRHCCLRQTCRLEPMPRPYERLAPAPGPPAPELCALETPTPMEPALHEPPYTSTPPTPRLMFSRFPSAPFKVICRCCFKNSRNICYKQCPNCCLGPNYHHWQ